MPNVLIVRRRRLGAPTCRGIARHMRQLLHDTGSCVSVWRNDTPFPIPEEGGMYHHVIRWGCTASLPREHVPTDLKVVNPAKAIHRVGNKLGFVNTMKECEPSLQPTVLSSTDSPSDVPSNLFPAVLRPSVHAQGRKIWIVNSMSELQDAVLRHSLTESGWYARSLVDKAAEYRVFCMAGRVVNVARKIPANESDLAWNVAQGGEFRNVRWNDWPLDACSKALSAFSLSKLDFGGVDVMVGRDGQSWVIEINSAPSLPLKSDGTPTYRQRCMATAIGYHVQNDWSVFEPPELPITSYQQVIHPTISSGVQDTMDQ